MLWGLASLGRPAEAAFISALLDQTIACLQGGAAAAGALSTVEQLNAPAPSDGVPIAGATEAQAFDARSSAGQGSAGRSSSGGVALSLSTALYAAACLRHQPSGRQAAALLAALECNVRGFRGQVRVH